MMETDDVAKADAPSVPSAETETEAREWVYGSGGGLAAAEGGDAAAQRRLGLLYLNGVGVGKKDFGAAESWLAKAHAQGDELAGGGLFLLRFGERARFSQALEMLPSLKGEGLDLALDVFFEAVEIFSGDKRTAPLLAILLQAPEHARNPYVAVALGGMLLKGQGVNRDARRAFAAYKIAAEAGIEAAQYKLGTMYDDGIGVRQDYAKAIPWYRLAAEQGSGPAQLELATIYDSEDLDEHDPEEALKWASLAAAQGCEGAVELFEELQLKAVRGR